MKQVNPVETLIGKLLSRQSTSELSKWYHKNMDDYTVNRRIDCINMVPSSNTMDIYEPIDKEVEYIIAIHRLRLMQNLTDKNILIVIDPRTKLIVGMLEEDTFHASYIYDTIKIIENHIPRFKIIVDSTNIEGHDVINALYIRGSYNISSIYIDNNNKKLLKEILISELITRYPDFPKEITTDMIDFNLFDIRLKTYLIGLTIINDNETELNNLDDESIIEMTIEEIEKKLGHRIRIVSRKVGN